MANEGVKINGFTVLQMKWKSESKATHYIYLKEHSVRENDRQKPKGQTLFVLNIPPFCNEELLRQQFSKCGNIVNIFLYNKPTSGAAPVDTSEYFPVTHKEEGYKVAYIVFRKGGSVQRALKLPYDKPLILTNKDNPPKHVGMHKWCQQYKDNIVDRKELQNEIDSYMAEFDEKVQKELEKAKEQEGVPDEDGWITVTKTAKKAAPLTEKHQEKAKNREKQKRKRKELLNFYSFQMRDTKKEQIALLRKKFEEDKQRIALMKASRKFRPY